MLIPFGNLFFFFLNLFFSLLVKALSELTMWYISMVQNNSFSNHQKSVTSLHRKESMAVSGLSLVPLQKNNKRRAWRIHPWGPFLCSGSCYRLCCSSKLTQLLNSRNLGLWQPWEWKSCLKVAPRLLSQAQRLQLGVLRVIDGAT